MKIFLGKRGVSTSFFEIPSLFFSFLFSNEGWIFLIMVWPSLFSWVSNGHLHLVSDPSKSIDKIKMLRFVFFVLKDGIAVRPFESPWTSILPKVNKKVIPLVACGPLFTSPLRQAFCQSEQKSKSHL